MVWDQVWEKIFRERDWGKYPPESLIRFIAVNFYQKDRKKVKILEVGSGLGANLWYVAREGFNAYGIDGSHAAVEKARKWIGEEGLTVDLRVGDIVELPYEDDYFDAVIDIGCLCCNSWEDSTKIIKEIKRVTKNGGLFYSKTFSDSMYVGQSNVLLGPLQYKDISDGPLAGKGLNRLTPKKGISELYGNYLDVLSVDKLEYTVDNGSILVSEWVIVAKKNI
jgi:SAM-dependent methyltransferase